MSETNLNRNQIQTLNTDRLTVFACDKVFKDLHDTLLQKGVDSSEISADNPTGLVDAVKALPTNTVGGINAKYPIAIVSDSVKFSDTSNYYDIVSSDGDDFLIQQANGSYTQSTVTIKKLNGNNWSANPNAYATFTTLYTLSLSKVNAALSAAGSSISLTGTIYFKPVPNTLKFAWIVQTGKYMNTLTYTGLATYDPAQNAITTTAVAVSADEGSAALPSSYGNVDVMAVSDDGAKLLYRGISSGSERYAFVDTTTGKYMLNTAWTWQSLLSGNRYGSAAKNLGGKWFWPMSSTGVNTVLFTPDWSDYDNSTVTNILTNYIVGYGYCDNKIFMMTFRSGTGTLYVYDMAAGTLTTKTLSTLGYKMFLGARSDSGYSYSISNSYCSQSLYVEKTADGNYAILGGWGFILIDEHYDLLPPYSGTTYVGMYLKQGQIAANNFTNNDGFAAYLYAPIKYDGKFYFINATQNVLVPVYYDKVLFNVFERNGSLISYCYSGPVTKTLLDGTSLDADTVSLTVDVADNEGAE